MNISEFNAIVKTLLFSESRLDSSLFPSSLPLALALNNSATDLEKFAVWLGAGESAGEQTSLFTLFGWLFLLIISLIVLGLERWTIWLLLLMRKPDALAWLVEAVATGLVTARRFVLSKLLLKGCELKLRICGILLILVETSFRIVGFCWRPCCLIVYFEYEFFQ